MKISTLIAISLSLFLTLVLMSCTDSSSSDSNSSAPPSNGGNGQEPQARTNCGVVKNGNLKNPVSDSDGIPVRLEQVADGNAFIASTANGKILIKLHATEIPSSSRDTAINFLKRYTGSIVLFIRASESCSAIISGGGQAQVGQLITSSGESIAETLTRTGFVTAGNSDACSSELISGCFNALQESDPLTAGELDSFLWKPESDSNGNLAIHTGPYNTTVSVSGEIGQNQGPGNGYGSLARFNRPGCAYSNPRVVVRSSSGFPYTVGGQTSFSIPNPCGRHCLENGKIVACSKN